MRWSQICSVETFASRFGMGTEADVGASATPKICPACMLINATARDSRLVPFAMQWRARAITQRPAPRLWRIESVCRPCGGHV